MKLSMPKIILLLFLIILHTRLLAVRNIEIPEQSTGPVEVCVALAMQSACAEAITDDGQDDYPDSCFFRIVHVSNGIQLLIIIRSLDAVSSILSEHLSDMHIVPTVFQSARDTGVSFVVIEDRQKVSDFIESLERLLSRYEDAGIMLYGAD